MLISSWQLSPSPCLVPSSLLLSTAFKKKFAIMTHAYKIKTQPLKGKTRVSVERLLSKPFQPHVWQIVRLRRPTPWYPWGALSVYLCACVYIYVYFFVCIYLPGKFISSLIKRRHLGQDEMVTDTQLWKEPEQFALPSTSALVSGTGFKNSVIIKIH